MSNSDLSVLDDEVIDISPTPARKGGGRLKWLIVPILLLVVILWNGISVYTDSLWYGSLGFESRFWQVFALGWILFGAFGLLTFAILRTGFYILERLFGINKMVRRKVVVNQQPMDIDPPGIIRFVGWALTLVIAVSFALRLSSDWQSWTLFFNQVPTTVTDPIFGNSLGFYLFTFPILSSVTGWLLTLSIVLLAAAGISAFVSALPTEPVIGNKPPVLKGISANGYSAISATLGFTMLIAAARVMLSRYEYLWQDNASFSGVTFTEANYLIPGYTFLTAAMVVGAIVLFFNAITKKRRGLIAAAIGIPLAVYLVGIILIPAYVQNFIVKPNELGRETPYIEFNIAATRAAFNIDNVEARDYPADTSTNAFNLAENQSTISNIRLWDWRALQDTLRQIQELRTYYDFPDVDVDRYMVNGELRQVMLATRELDVNKLPDQSRNWINERLVYTHGYGVTMNLVNEFTNDGKPRFLLSNMPIETSANIKVTRPEIYFGESTDTNVYVKTTQKEFDHPQGENNNYSNYEGDGGFAVGSGIRRFCIASATGDLTKLPFSDDVKADSRVLMIRNIAERIQRIAPFLKYDTDPYIVITDDGHLVWMVDAFTTADRYPYSRHYADFSGKSVNYMRNSVKVTINAYDGTVNFYVFDEGDPIIQTWRASFPELFKNADEMPADLRLHVRYPETYIKTQGDVYGLYHTQAASTFFGREDVWSIARDAASGNGKPGEQNTNPLDPYQVLMPLPGEQAEAEFVQVLPFTPSNRNNMIAWMAGRSDGDSYGQLLAYTFPTSRVIDGPAQIEARIDQDATLAGQITLWSQQGSKVKRGDLIIMPIGTGLLYVEPIYLQADRSPMPELRLVVLATQDRLTYAANFETALKQLLGQTPPPLADSAKKDESPKKVETNAPKSNDELIQQAARVFADYQRLTAEGKLGEAGQKLDELKSILSGSRIP